MCEVHKKGFVSILSDNEESYLSYLIGCIESVDELSSIQITRNPENISFRLAPSSPKYSESILKEILDVHNLFGIKLEISKSIKSSAVINFKIPIAF